MPGMYVFNVYRRTTLTLPSDVFLYEAISDLEYLCFGFCSPPPAVKSEPQDTFFHSPKLEKSLKRERADDNE